MDTVAKTKNRKGNDLLPCKCGQNPHKSFCPVWRRENKRMYNAGLTAMYTKPYVYHPAKPKRVSFDPYNQYAEKINAHYRRWPVPCGEFTGDEWELLCIIFDFTCARCCQDRPLLADHVVGVHSGGRNEIANIQPLCQPCNSAKNKKTTDYRWRIDMEDPEIISRAMSLLGQRKSDRKKAAGQANIAHANTFRTRKPCNCGRDPHKGTCPVYHREYTAARRKKLENSSPQRLT